MKALLLLSLWVMQLGFSEPSICSSSPPPLRLSQLPIKTHSAFTFKIILHRSPIDIHHSSSGTFFKGNVSSVVLQGSGSIHQYKSTSFSFKYPPQHRIAEVSQEVIQMQIMYELSSSNVPKWKHKNLVLSVSFVLTEYSPDQGYTLGKQMNKQLQNGSTIDFKALLPLVPGLNMVLFKGVHSALPEDKSTLWLIRREFLLMSFKEFEQIKDLCIKKPSGQGSQYHGLLQRTSDLNEIKQWTNPTQELQL